MVGSVGMGSILCKFLLMYLDEHVSGETPSEGEIGPPHLDLYGTMERGGVQYTNPRAFG